MLVQKFKTLGKHDIKFRRFENFLKKSNVKMRLKKVQKKNQNRMKISGEKFWKVRRKFRAVRKNQKNLECRKSAKNTKVPSNFWKILKVRKKIRTVGKDYRKFWNVRKN